jgi:hypothetical protein
LVSRHLETRLGLQRGEASIEIGVLAEVGCHNFGRACAQHCQRRKCRERVRRIEHRDGNTFALPQGFEGADVPAADLSRSREKPQVEPGASMNGINELGLKLIQRKRCAIAETLALDAD